MTVPRAAAAGVKPPLDDGVDELHFDLPHQVDWQRVSVICEAVRHHESRQA